ncbi:hypothetical protein GCM10010517_26450 [Streptosporangium fragile]|uniref:Uncharacterized protein n=1 Tax=Streptosporangium fragile TaxID=46186 RepID=A0ABP6IEV5_9ACTN
MPSSTPPSVALPAPSVVSVPPVPFPHRAWVALLVLSPHRAWVALPVPSSPPILVAPSGRGAVVAP